MCMCIQVHRCTGVCVCACVYMCMYTCMYLCMYRCMCVHVSSGEVECRTQGAPGRLGGHGGGDYLLISAFVEALRVSK